MSNITITISGSGSGTVTSSALPTLSCPGTCTVTHPTIGFPPYNFDLIATPDPGSSFVGWTVTDQGGGDLTPVSSSNNPETFVYNNSDSNYTINAEFIDCPTLGVVPSGPFAVTAGVPITPIQLVGTGGSGSYSFSTGSCGPILCCDAWIEGGLSISPTGLITGTPTVYGCAGCECAGGVVVTDTETGCSSTVCLTFQQNCCPVISYTPHGPFNYTVDQPFTPVTLIPSGGVGPYLFQVADTECPEEPSCSGIGFPPGITIGPLTGTISGTATAEATCEWVPILITDANDCTSTSCLRMVAQEPIQTCYYLVPCAGGLTLLVTNNFGLYVGQVISILDQCFSVLIAPNCVGAITLPSPVVTGPFVDCLTCNPPHCYELIDCSLQTPSIVTSTNLATYAGQTIKVCELTADLVAPIDGLPYLCIFPYEQGFVTKVTGPTTGLYYDVITDSIKPYTNPLLISTAVGSGICVNPISPFDISSSTGSIWTIQIFIGTTPITNPISISTALSIAALQYFIDQQIIYPNTTVTVTNFDLINHLTLTVVVNTTVPEGQVIIISTPNGSIPTSSAVDFTGGCICYTVTDLGPCTTGVPFTEVIAGSFLDCECCNPPPIVPDPPYIPTPPAIDKHTYRIPETQCDIDVNKSFASAMYDLFKQKQYGIASCCNINQDKAWIAKELSDLSKIKC